jgi:Kef-type K+ transport system membrane component KefB/voltage-gated potassium channel Kch
VAFLAAGVALGPNGLGALSGIVPGVDVVTIRDRVTISTFAELGVVFLLFVIGLELSPARLMTMRRLVFGLGGAQVVTSAAVVALGASFVMLPQAALVIGTGLALSSTAIVIEVLAHEKRVSSATGRASFAILIFQDLAVVPILFLVGALGPQVGSSIVQGLILALLQAVVTIGLIVVAGTFLLRPLFRLVAGPDNPELFMAATLLVAIGTALLLAPAGEFAFVIFALAGSRGILTAEQAALAVATASLSMALVPLLGIVALRLGHAIERPSAVEPEAAVLPPVDNRQRAIVIGYGRVGRLVAEMLGRHGVSHIAVDNDAKAVARWRKQNDAVYWGDASNPLFLQRCGLMEASAVVVTVNDAKQTARIVAAARALRPDLVIVARSRDADHARALYEIGATDAVPETIEASLQLSEAALAGLGVAAGPVIASIHERRDEFRRELQSAAGRPTRAVKPKRRGAAP